MSSPFINTSRARFMALMYPKEGITFEEFDAYWLQEHSKIFMSLDIVQKNLTRYEQVRSDHTLGHLVKQSDSSAM